MFKRDRIIKNSNFINLVTINISFLSFFLSNEPPLNLHIDSEKEKRKTASLVYHNEKSKDSFFFFWKNNRQILFTEKDSPKKIMIFKALDSPW
jgi:hypothetical protein